MSHQVEEPDFDYTRIPDSPSPYPFVVLKILSTLWVLTDIVPPLGIGKTCPAVNPTLRDPASQNGIYPLWPHVHLFVVFEFPVIPNKPGLTIPQLPARSLNFLQDKSRILARTDTALLRTKGGLFELVSRKAFCTR